MPERIIIEGDVASIETTSVVRRVPLAELLGRIEKVPPITLPTIPRTQVFGHWVHQPELNRTTMYILAELQPGVRTITKNNKRRLPRGRRRYRLSFPWTYFFFTATTSDYANLATTKNWSVSEGRVFFAKDKYEDINSSLMVASVPNISGHTGEICWGNTGTPARQNLADQIDQRVSAWYLSDFNDDLDSGIHLPYGEINFKRWVDESRADPSSWRNWPEWAERSRIFTMKSLLENMDNIQLDISERFEGLGFIPNIEMPATFGGWEDWWRTIPQNERIRGLRAAENMLADDPAIFDEEEYDEDETIDGPVDDGGVPV